MATEDFSFPTISDSPPCFIYSPPLWRPCNFIPSSHEETERGSQPKPSKCSQRKSFSCAEGCVKTATEDGGEDEEEMMDMLWEDLNEELPRSCGSGPDSRVSPGKVVEFGCMKKALKLSNKGPSVVVFMKVLKKLFMLHNSHHRTVKKRAW